MKCIKKRVRLFLICWTIASFFMHLNQNAFFYLMVEWKLDRSDAETHTRAYTHMLTLILTPAHTQTRHQYRRDSGAAGCILRLAWPNLFSSQTNAHLNTCNCAWAYSNTHTQTKMCTHTSMIVHLTFYTRTRKLRELGATECDQRDVGERRIWLLMTKLVFWDTIIHVHFYAISKCPELERPA